MLIIDDDESALETFGRMLRLEGYEVQTAASAEAAFRKIETFRPDVILLDLRMPSADGIVFLRRLRAVDDNRHTPVAVITGDYVAGDTIARELQELEADLYFKPVWLMDLVGIAQGLLDRRTE